jgi:nicotinamidase-related amidase
MMRGLSNGETVALIISECQRAMVDDEFRGQRDALARVVEDDGILPSIADLAENFRAMGHPVVHSWLRPRSDWSAFSVNCALSAVLKKTNTCREGTESVEPHPTVAPHDGDLTIQRRTGLTSFAGTDLDAQLRALGVQTVVLVGVSINVAVYGSTLEAVNRGYNVVIPTDCVAGVGPAVEPMLSDIYPLLATMTTRDQIIAELQNR